jgi:hypothetical protein
MSEVGVTTRTAVGWLSPDDLDQARAHLPLVYVDAVPVRIDGRGEVTQVGLLLRVAADGSISRMVVSGRVMYGERIRDALLRHLEKDLGPLALPDLPTNPAPFTVVEYFPDPGVSGFHDPRHHAVSLAYVVPVAGDCVPTQEALDLAWFSPAEAIGPAVRDQMTGGHDRLLRLALRAVRAADPDQRARAARISSKNRRAAGCWSVGSSSTTSGAWRVWQPGHQYTTLRRSPWRRCRTESPQRRQR